VALYQIYAYLHVLGALGWFLSLGIEAVVLTQLGRATSPERAREVLASLRGNRILGPVAALLLLVPGVYLAETAWSAHPPWIGAGYLTFILVFALGAAVTGRRLVRLERELGRPGGTSQRFEAPMSALRVSYYARLGLLLGATFAMVVKPEAAGCMTAVGFGLALGLVASWAANRSARTGVERAIGAHVNG
jgi:hypothetical protein